MKIQEDAFIAGYLTATKNITTTLRAHIKAETGEDLGEYPMDDDDRKDAEEAFIEWEKENG